MHAMSRLYGIALICLGLLFTSLSYGDTVKQTQSGNMVSADKSIQDYEETVVRLRSQAILPVLHPHIIPPVPKGQKLYGDGQYIREGGYRIYVGTTKDCKGVKVCNVGEIEGIKGALPSRFKNRDGNIVTQDVTLLKSIQGYYTPSHAMGDYWPGMISWQCGRVLYRIGWKTDPALEKSALIKMANSSISSTDCKRDKK